MKVSEQILATGIVPPTLRRYGCTVTDAAGAAAWLRQHPMLDHEVLAPLAQRLRTVKPSAGRKLTQREIRTQQQKFRERVGRAYGWRCAITGYRERAGLEAAHLTEPGGWRTHNEARHGVLLRSDLHGLFDAGLIRFVDGRVRVDAAVKEDSVRALDGVAVRVPRRRGDWPVGRGMVRHRAESGVTS